MSESKLSVLDNTSFQYSITDEGSIKIEKYLQDDTEIIIPATIENRPVKIIGMKAFMNMPVKRVILSDSIERIEALAFAECKELEAIHFPKSVKTVGKSAFASCFKLSEVTRETEDIIYDSNAFYRCSELTSFVIPKAMKHIPQALVARCYKLVDVTIPEGTISLGRAVFGQDYALRKVYFPASITDIDPEVLTFLTDITVQVKEGSYAWLFCQEHGYNFEIV